MNRDIDDREYYIDYSRDLFDFLIASFQWSGIDSNRLNAWFHNFEEDDNGEYYACKILNGVIGYSENDMKRMVDDGIERIMHKEAVLPLLKQKNFSVLESELEFAFRDKLKRTLFVPLLVNGIPGESSMSIMRIITQRVKPSIQQLFPSEIPDDYPCDVLIVVDDCIGSGHQFSEFWESATISGGKLLSTWCSEHGIHAYYLCLVAYNQKMNEIQGRYNDISIVAIEQLTDSHRVFNEGNKEWNSKKEMEDAKACIEKLIIDKGVNLFGYEEMDFAVIIHNNIPDWSLPILHKEKNGWKLLVERKDSND
ncbi:hypothetical protein SAMN02910301_0409 [Lachnospiraceae bacterium XBD2001]|nr:hypothetical protein SAMN02910301_0409 [Lachnospiraceae bacterium XBD2001]